MEIIFNNLQLNKVLDEILDTRLKPTDEIPVGQLRNECKKRNLSDKGLKVNYIAVVFCCIMIPRCRTTKCLGNSDCADPYAQDR